MAYYKQKQVVRERLLSEQGLKHRKKRCADVEATFGLLKQNMGFTRFTLRGISGVNTEAGLFAIAHNIKKAAA